MELQGKVVLITGAKGGLGTFVTNSFLEAGARVFGVSRSIADSDFPHPNFSAVAAELSDGDRARQVAEAVVNKAGRIDGLVHLVGAFAGGKSVAETDDATLDKMLDLNLRSAFHVIRAVLPIMRAQGSGRIVCDREQSRGGTSRHGWCLCRVESSTGVADPDCSARERGPTCVCKRRAAGHDGHTRQSCH